MGERTQQDSPRLSRRVGIGWELSHPTGNNDEDQQCCGNQQARHHRTKKQCTHRRIGHQGIEKKRDGRRNQRPQNRKRST
jgi:hypothetical protein